MAIDVYKETVNPITGESFKCISHDENAYIMEWAVKPEGYVPFEHIHFNQDELFHVKEGEVKVVIEGKEHIGKAGETVTVPKGKKHIAFNNSKSHLKCVVEYKPRLDHHLFSQCFNGLIEDGHYDKKGGPSIPKMGYMIRDMKALARPTNIPAPVFKITLGLFGLIGGVSGWGKLYKKYTGFDK
ncbi:MAG TPA: cupin domain-containing protein [Bacteroidia bacterium]|jgi:quercetin dioxygenase-like cupin family protein|nr:cupin domain-containing protein [Bacteroidia bacterium]